MGGMGDDIGLESGQISGTFIESGGGVGRVKNVLVAKEERGKGLGRIIMREAETLAFSRGLSSLELEVDTENTAALNLCTCFATQRAANRICSPTPQKLTPLPIPTATTALAASYYTTAHQR